jgi:hypothetical protein
LCELKIFYNDFNLKLILNLKVTKPGDKVIKVFNKGWYIADLRLYYYVKDSAGDLEQIKQLGLIATNSGS